MFCKDKSKPDGYHNQCKSCAKKRYEKNKEKISAKKREYYQQNREKALAYGKEHSQQRKENTKKYYQRNKERITASQQAYRERQKGNVDYTLRLLLGGARKRSKANNLPFDLTIEWLETMVISHCPITLQPIDWLKERVANGVPGPNSPSIDKNNPELGYVQANCAIVSFRGNTIKNNGTIDEHYRVVQYMAAQQLRDTEF